MEDYNNKYDALVETIKIEDIATDKTNQDILRRLKQNDETFNNLWICNDRGFARGSSIIKERAYICYTEELGWLGYFIGKSTNLKEVNFYVNINDTRLFKGLGNNKSIRKICFVSFLFNERIFEWLDPFLKNNHNLAAIDINECVFDDGGAHQLSQVLGGCNSKSLKRISLSGNNIGGEQLVDIILSLNMHPQLEHLGLARLGIERNRCTALATVLRNTTKQLQTLYLHGNNIDDEGVEALTNAISTRDSDLVELSLSRNPTITIRGWKMLSTLLEMPDSPLERLHNSDNNIGDEGAFIFANALKGNCKLKVLSLHGNGITHEGWAHFSKLLCDTSSVNKTYLSNHTLENLETTRFTGPPFMPADVQLYQVLNASSENKGYVATTKILQHHSHFTVQPFFEWEFKVLPLMITWLEKARTCDFKVLATISIFGVDPYSFEDQINRMKLSVAYDFVREFPMLYIEPVTRKEIEDCSAMEKKLQGDQSKLAELEEVQQRKERAMRRLF